MRLGSTMTAKQLKAWRKRYAHTLDSGAEALGVTKMSFCRYLNGSQAIPMPVALLCWHIDELAALQSREAETPEGK